MSSGISSLTVRTGFDRRLSGHQLSSAPLPPGFSLGGSAVLFRSKADSCAHAISASGVYKLHLATGLSQETHYGRSFHRPTPLPAGRRRRSLCARESAGRVARQRPLCDALSHPHARSAHFGRTSHFDCSCTQLASLLELRRSPKASCKGDRAHRESSQLARLPPYRGVITPPTACRPGSTIPR